MQLSALESPYQRVDKKLSLSSQLVCGYGIRDLGPRIWKKTNPDPEVKKTPDPGSGSETLATYLSVDDVGDEGGGHGLEVPVGLGQGGAELVQGVAHVQRHIVPSKVCIREYFFRIRIRNPDPGGQLMTEPDNLALLSYMYDINTSTTVL